MFQRMSKSRNGYSLKQLKSGLTYGLQIVTEGLWRLSLPRSRYTIIRLALMILLAGGMLSLITFKSKALYFSERTGTSSVYGSAWSREASLMEDPDDDLVADGSTMATTTMQSDVQEQLAKKALEFAEASEAQPINVGVDDDEDRHIGVERKEIQLLEEDDMMDLESPEGGVGLLVDDHVHGLVDDVGIRSHDSGVEHAKHDHLFEDPKSALPEHDLEAVAHMAAMDAMRDSDEQNFARLGDVEEAVEWQKEADVDWEEDDEEVEREMEEEEEKINKKTKKKQEKNQNQKKIKKKDKYLKLDDEHEDWEDEEETTTYEPSSTTMMSTTGFEASTYESTTEEPLDEIAREEAEEHEIFDAPEKRKIGRLLLKLGLDGRNRRFRTALETHSRDKKILLTLSDSRYTMMVLNFYESTVLKNGIDNVLFGSLDGKLCAKLDALNIPCFIYARENITSTDIRGGVRKIFNRKVYYRARMILEAIAMGYTVLYSDADTSFYRDPFADIEALCGNCDVAFQQFSVLRRKLSWGVNYVKPTIASLYLYYSIARKGYNRSNIALPNKFINRLDRQGRLNITRLPLKKCRSGIDFYEHYKFGWEHRCRGCISLHSDEFYTKEAKMYRLKELLLWNLNLDKYYTNRNRKYLEFDNPYVFHNGTETLIMEMKALRNALALGQILRRTVILPRFHCFVPTPREGEPDPSPPTTKWCNLHDVLRVEDFHRWFMGRYREHSFLSHPKVPRVVKKNISSVHYIGNKIPLDPSSDGQSVIPANVTLIKPKMPLYGAQSEEIRVLFEHMDVPVLRFHSLYYGFSHFLSDEIARTFNRRIKLGFDFRKRVHYTVRKLKVKRPLKPGTLTKHGPAAPPAILIPSHLNQGTGHGSAHHHVPAAAVNKPPEAGIAKPDLVEEEEEEDDYDYDDYDLDQSPQKSDMFMPPSNEGMFLN